MQSGGCGSEEQLKDQLEFGKNVGGQAVMDYGWKGGLDGKVWVFPKRTKSALLFRERAMTLDNEQLPEELDVGTSEPREGHMSRESFATTPIVPAPKIREDSSYLLHRQ